MLRLKGPYALLMIVGRVAGSEREERGGGVK